MTEALNNYISTYDTTDTIQKRILHSNLSDEDKIYLIEMLSKKSNWPDYPNTPWINSPPVYCYSDNKDEVYLTEKSS